MVYTLNPGIQERVAASWQTARIIISLIFIIYLTEYYINIRKISYSGKTPPKIHHSQAIGERSH